MRILHVVNYGWPFVDGYTVRTAGLVTAQREHLGWEPHVLTAPFAPYATARDPDFTTAAWGPHATTSCEGPAESWERPGLGLAPASARRLRSAVVAAARDHRAEVVHVHHPHFVAAPAMAAAAALDLPTVYELRCFNGDYDRDRAGWWPQRRGQLFNLLEGRAARRADAVVTIAEGLAARLRSAGVDDPRIVRNAVDTARFSPDGPVAARPDVAVHVGYATTFSRIEGIDLLLDAVAAARPRLGDGDLHVTLAGVGEDRDRLVQRASALGLDRLVSFPGFVPFSAMPAFHRSLDLFVVPRHDATVVQDTTPLKPLEAIACGTPVWSVDLPAMRELLTGHQGTATFPGDAGALAERLLAAVADPPARAVPDLAERTWASEVHRYRDVYAGLGLAVAA